MGCTLVQGGECRGTVGVGVACWYNGGDVHTVYSINTYTPYISPRHTRTYTQYILPTQGPDLARMLAPLSLAMSPVLWQQHKPDRFDMYSAGVLGVAVYVLYIITAGCVCV